MQGILEHLRDENEIPPKYCKRAEKLLKCLLASVLKLRHEISGAHPQTQVTSRCRAFPAIPEPLRGPHEARQHDVPPYGLVLHWGLFCNLNHALQLRAESRKRPQTWSHLAACLAVDFLPAPLVGAVVTALTGCKFTLSTERFLLQNKYPWASQDVIPLSVSLCLSGTKIRRKTKGPVKMPQGP